MRLDGWHPGPGNPTGQEQRISSEYGQGQLPPTTVAVSNLPLTYSSTQEVSVPEPPLLAAQQVMWMWGRGALGPFLMWVVRQQLQDRKDPEVGTEQEPREVPTHPKFYSHHLWAEHWALMV